MAWILYSASVSLIGSLSIAMTFGFVYLRGRETHIGRWAIGWGLFALKAAFEGLAGVYPNNSVYIFGFHLTAILGSLVVFGGILAFLEKSRPIWLKWAAILVLAAVSIGLFKGFAGSVLNVPTISFIIATFVWSAVILSRAKHHDRMGRYMTVLGLLTWAVVQAGYLIPDRAAALWVNLAVIPEFIMAIGLLFIYYGRLRRQLIFNGDGGIIGYEGIVSDIAERTEEERRQAEEVFKRYELLSRHARDFIIFFRRNGQILEANEAIIQIYGYTRQELLAMKISDLRAPQFTADLEEKLSEAEANGILYETVHQRKDRTTFPVEVSLQATVFDNEKVLFGIIRDITDRKRAEERINHLAYHDPLTDLPNRILFYDRLSVALANAKRNSNKAAVMFLDLDRFKIVNDMMGHSNGDRLLSEVGQLLASCVRADDTVGRLGGDEFTILLPIIKREEDAAIVARKIIESFRKPWILEGREFQITASIGIALYPNDGNDADSLTQSADTAMYRAKEDGDNYQFFTPVMNTRALERMELEISLRKALEQHEFEVYYQPQFDSRTRQVIGVEGLLRWHHPKRGVVMPGDFITITEETGLIVSIGEWILRTACQQHISWQKKGYAPTRVAVNISAYQFKQKDFVEMLAKVLRETKMDPSMLELEITESAAMQDADFTISMLKQLSEMGVRIAIDDFGTGYSSLSYLRRFPITTIKVDQSFVRDVLCDPEDASIVSAIIVLAKNLKLNVVVEGVETEGQLEFFERHRCFEMQGYLFSRPEPAITIEKFLIIEEQQFLEQAATYS